MTQAFLSRWSVVHSSVVSSTSVGVLEGLHAEWWIVCTGHISAAAAAGGSGGCGGVVLQAPTR